MSDIAKFERSRLQRLTALLGLFLVLAFAGLETTHSHPAATLSNRAGTPCVICISVHSNAPAATFHPLPVLHAIATVSVLCQSSGVSAAPQSSLFIRPPPAA